MNVDKGLIRHWAMLFESQDKKNEVGTANLLELGPKLKWEKVDNSEREESSKMDICLMFVLDSINDSIEEHVYYVKNGSEGPEAENVEFDDSENGKSLVVYDWLQNGHPGKYYACTVKSIDGKPLEGGLKENLVRFQELLEEIVYGEGKMNTTPFWISDVMEVPKRLGIVSDIGDGDAEMEMYRENELYSNRDLFDCRVQINSGTYRIEIDGKLEMTLQATRDFGVSRYVKRGGAKKAEGPVKEKEEPRW